MSGSMQRPGETHCHSLAFSPTAVSVSCSLVPFLFLPPPFGRFCSGCVCVVVCVSLSHVTVTVTAVFRSIFSALRSVRLIFEPGVFVRVPSSGTASRRQRGGSSSSTGPTTPTGELPVRAHCIDPCPLSPVPCPLAAAAAAAG